MWKYTKTIETLRICLRDNLRVVGLSNLLLIIISGLAAFSINLIDPAFDALFLALIFGIFLGSFYADDQKKAIVEKSLAITLPVGITLYGANINFPYLDHFNPKIVFVTLFLATTMAVAIFLLARSFSVSRSLALLLACGTGICGVSAIAIISPLVKPKKEEFSAAIIIITVVGLTGAVLYPTLGYIFSLPSDIYALMSGATLHQTGLVKIASKSFGDDVLAEALAIKGIRIAMIALVTLVISIIYSERRFYVPWYVVTFLAVALFSSVYLPTQVVEVLKPLSTIAFSITLASIGFTVNIREVQKVRLTPLILAYTGWFTALAMFVAFLRGGLI